MAIPVTQTATPPANLGNNVADPITTLLQQIGAKNQSLENQAVNTLPGLTQQQAIMPGSNNVPMTSAGTPVGQPVAPTQPGEWKTSPALPGGARPQQDMGTLISNVGNLVHNAANNLNQKRIREATNNWSRLMTAMANPNDLQNKAIVQDILSDPKTLKQMSKALDIDWLNPSKGADNVYRQALNAAITKHKLKEGAIAKLKDLLSGGAQNDVKVNLTPQQRQQLAQQMAARFPKSPQSSAVLADQVKSKLYNTILNDPRGVAHAVQSLPLEEQQLLGIGPSANAMLDAQVKSQIASAELDQKNQEFAVNINQKIADRQQQYSEFQQTQNRLNQTTQMNFTFKMKDLQQRIAQTTVAGERVKLQMQANDIAHQRLEYSNVSNQLNTVMKQLTLLTNQEKMLTGEYKTQTNAMPIFGTKKTGITSEGQKKIDDIEKQIKSLNTTRINLLKKQGSLMSGLNNLSSLGGNSGKLTPESGSQAKDVKVPQYKMGDEVTYKGKKYTVVGIKGGQYQLKETSK